MPYTTLMIFVRDILVVARMLVWAFTALKVRSAMKNLTPEHPAAILRPALPFFYWGSILVIIRNGGLLLDSIWRGTGWGELGFSLITAMAYMPIAVGIIGLASAAATKVGK